MVSFPMAAMAEDLKFSSFDAEMSHAEELLPIPKVNEEYVYDLKGLIKYVKWAQTVQYARYFFSAHCDIVNGPEEIFGNNYDEDTIMGGDPKNEYQDKYSGKYLACK